MKIEKDTLSVTNNSNKLVDDLFSSSSENDFYNYFVFIKKLNDKNLNEKVEKELGEKNIKISNLKIVKYSLKNMALLNLHFSKSINFSNYNKNYTNIIKKYSKLANDLNINKSVELCIFFEYLLKNGYFSIDKKLVYFNDKECNVNMGPFSVMSGSGVCRNFSFLLYDFLTYNHIDCDLYLNYVKDDFLAIVEKIFGNHLVCRINDEGLDYIFDPTDDNFALHVKNRTYKSIFNDNKHHNYYRSRNYFENEQSINSVLEEKFINYYNLSRDKVYKAIEYNYDLIDAVYNRCSSDITLINKKVLKLKKKHSKSY